jgi:hypothetical protein
MDWIRGMLPRQQPERSASQWPAQPLTVRSAFDRFRRHGTCHRARSCSAPRRLLSRCRVAARESLGCNQSRYRGGLILWRGPKPATTSMPKRFPGLVGKIGSRRRPREARVDDDLRAPGPHPRRAHTHRHAQSPYSAAAIEAAYHRADAAIQQLIELVAV